MAYFHILSIKHEPIFRALRNNPDERDNIADEIGRTVLDLTVRDSHRIGPADPASRPFREIPNVICSTGSIHNDDHSYFVWTGDKFIYRGSEGRMTSNQIDELRLLHSLSSPDCVVEQLDDEQSSYAIRDINAGKKTIAEYELPDAIASIYEVCEDMTRSYDNYDGNPPYIEVGKEILGTLTSTFTLIHRPFEDVIKRATILKPEFCLFYWKRILSPVKRDSAVQMMKPLWFRYGSVVSGIRQSD